MREILFRGKRADNGEWVYGDLIHRRIWTSDCVLIRTQDSGFDNFDEYEVIPDSISEYTGLTDKNGKKIFEGDILRKARYPECDTIVVYEGGGFRFKALHGRYGLYIKGENVSLCFVQQETERLKVIGNIHDNPELLEVEE